MPLFPSRYARLRPEPVRHELVLLRARCRVAGLSLRGRHLRGGRVALYADRVTVVGWVGLRRQRWDLLLLDIAVARMVAGGLRIELVGGSSLTLTLLDAEEWTARIVEYRACLTPPA